VMRRHRPSHPDRRTPTPAAQPAARAALAPIPHHPSSARERRQGDFAGRPHLPASPSARVGPNPARRSARGMPAHFFSNERNPSMITAT
jgi:hypothetical protein